jgi:hypothetical protein
MPLICSASLSPNACSHWHLTVNGQEVRVHESDLAGGALSASELTQLCILAVRAEGGTFAALSGKVVVGVEASSVKTIDLFGPGAALTKTNIGTAWVNICPGANGERVLVDLADGYTEYRLVASANLVGTGPFGIRVVRDSDDAVVYESASIALTGERELDTGWLAIPAGVKGSLLAVRAQAKSETASDDPVFRRIGLLVR